MKNLNFNEMQATQGGGEWVWICPNESGEGALVTSANYAALQQAWNEEVNAVLDLLGSWAAGLIPFFDQHLDEDCVAIYSGFDITVTENGGGGHSAVLN